MEDVTIKNKEVNKMAWLDLFCSMNDERLCYIDKGKEKGWCLESSFNLSNNNLGILKGFTAVILIY